MCYIFFCVGKRGPYTPLGPAAMRHLGQERHGQHKHRETTPFRRYTFLLHHSRAVGDHPCPPGRSAPWFRFLKNQINGPIFRSIKIHAAQAATMPCSRSPIQIPQGGGRFPCAYYIGLFYRFASALSRRAVWAMVILSFGEGVSGYSRETCSPAWLEIFLRHSSPAY